jgi:hypothetical protein
MAEMQIMQEQLSANVAKALYFLISPSRQEKEDLKLSLAETQSL